jgi:hypothetical protein
LIKKFTIYLIKNCINFSAKAIKIKLSLIILSVQIIFFSPYIVPGTIKGIVRNTSDHTILPGANVIIKGTTLGASADINGLYTISSVPPGTYTLEATAIGFGPVDDKVELKNNESVANKDFYLKEIPIKLNEVVIEARANKELETAARETEKTAGNVVNVISAQAIEQSTDRTAADVLQRVSGMSLVRSQGEGRYVVMRGLEQKYNNTLVDGIKIPSPESRDRFVPMDIFPSGLFERIEVTKALTPETAGDAIGGSTDLLLREAPEQFTFSFSTATGSTSGVLNNGFGSFNRNAVNELDPERMHGTVSDQDPTTQIKPRYNPSSSDFSTGNLKFSNSKPPLDGLYSGVIGSRFFDNSLGFIAAGSYQNTYNDTHTDFYSVTNNINRVDSDGHLIPYASTYNNQNYYTNKMRGGALVKSDFIAGDEHEINATYMYVHQEEDQVRYETQKQIDGTRGGADITYGNRSALRTQDISSITLGGSDFKKSTIDFRWTLNYTDAIQDRPDEAEYTILQNYDAHGNLQPFQGLGGITHTWRKNDDKQYLGKLDGIYHVTPDGEHTIQAGIVLQHLNRANYEDDYKLNPAIINGRTQTFTTIDSAIVSVFGSGSTSGTTVYGFQNYKANEFLMASYVQYTAIFGSLQILSGLRWEEAQDEYFTSANLSFSEQQANVKMVNFLPGIHFRYEFTPEQIGRFSITRSMSRPSYFDLVPAVERSDESSSTGNPNLRPALSTNLDLRYEYYPNPEDMYSAGFYYKFITDPIEDQYQSVGVVLVTSKGNASPAKVYGFEAVISKHLGGFGLSANYSYVFSQITSTKQVTLVDINGDLTQSFLQHTRPLQAQSPQIANVILSYQNKDWGLETNFSYNYTGRRLLAVGLLDGYDTYQDGVGEYDFSCQQKLYDNFNLSIKLINIFNSPAVTEVASGYYVKHDPIIILRDSNKMRATIGISYKL